MIVSKHVNILFVCVFLVAFGGIVFSGEPLKVFILAGQSNMQGHGEITKEGRQGTLEYVVDNDTDGTYSHLTDDGGNWAVRDDVWVYYERDESTTIISGLSAGFGAKSTTIGPELQFGHVMGDFYNEPVLIIKTAWGGKSLAVEFRPPSLGDVNDEIVFKTPKTADEQGYNYREMMAIVNAFKAAPQSYYPAYNAADGYEIVGFGWHQGWNDRVKEECVAQYERNMKHFIDDVRNDLGIPNLPFVITTTGMGGWDLTSTKALDLIDAQLAMEDFTAYPEFEGNVAVDDARDYWRRAEQSPADQGYHWNRSAEIHLLIGDGMGREMTGLIDPNVPSVNAGTSMVTWVGEPLILAPTVDVPAGSDWTDLTYAWAGEGPAGVTVTFDPVDPVAANDPTPTVTITKPLDDTEAIVTLTLSVNNTGRLAPPIADTMRVFVYDDDCKAAIAKGLRPDNPTDLDGDCVTGLVDFARLASRWLHNGGELTEPVPQLHSY